MDRRSIDSDGSGSTSRANPAYAHAPPHDQSAGASGHGSGGASSVGGVSNVASALAARLAAKRLTENREKNVVGSQNDYALKLSSGIPVRELMTQVFINVRGRSAREFLLYSVYVAVFVAVVLQINPSHTINMSNAALSNIFIDQEFQLDLSLSPKNETGEGGARLYRGTSNTFFKKTFTDIGDYGELAAWMKDVLVPGLYPEAWYNGAPYSDSERQFLIGGKYYALLGGARLWQVRIGNGTSACSDLQRFSRGRDNFLSSQFNRPGDGACYGEWTPEGQDTDPWGPADSGTATLRYQWSPTVTDPLYYAFGVFGWGTPFYGTSGYTAFLPNNGSIARRIVEQLLADRWIDAQTRALIIDFSVYNYDTGLQSTVRMQVETPPSGMFLPSYELFTLRTWRSLYVTPWDSLRALGEILLVLGCMRYIFKSVVLMARRGRIWDGGAWFEILVQILVLSCISYWMKTNRQFFQSTSYIESIKRNFPCNDPYTSDSSLTLAEMSRMRPSCWQDTYPYAQDYKYAITFAGCVGLLMALKFFSYFSIYHSLSLLWVTLAKAGMSLLAFCFGFCILVAGFAFMGQLCFGHIVPDFHSWPSSFSTLLRYPLGDFNYKDLTNARPEVAGTFFALYMALVFLVCINMVVAIITIAFEEVNQAAKIEEKWKHAGRSYFADLRVTIRLHYLMLARYFALHLGRGSSQFSCSRGSTPVRWTTSSASTEYGESGEPRSSSTASHFTEGSRESTNASIDVKVFEDWWGAKELALLCSDAYYIEMMTVFIETAEYTTSQDLMKYSEEVYLSSSQGTNYYIALNELCEMSRDPAYYPHQFCDNRHYEPGKGRLVELGDAENGHASDSLKDRPKSSAFSGQGQPRGPPSSGDSGTVPSQRIRRRSSSSSDLPTEVPESSASCTPQDAVQCCCSWKSRFIEYIDFRIGQSRRRGWLGAVLAFFRCILYLDFYRPIYRMCIEAGLPQDLYDTASDANLRERCVAYRMIQAYMATRRVTMLGRTTRHQWISQRQGDGSKACKGTWKVWKSNPVRTQRKRILAIVNESGSTFVLFNYEAGSERRLRRRLLLTQIVQIDQSVFEPNRLVLYIEARDQPTAGSLVLGRSDPFIRYDVPADSTYDVCFDSQVDRDHFVDVLMQCRNSMQQAIYTAKGLSTGFKGRALGSSAGSGLDGAGDGPTGGASSEPVPAARLSALSAASASAAGTGLGLASNQLESSMPGTASLQGGSNFLAAAAAGVPAASPPVHSSVRTISGLLTVERTSSAPMPVQPRPPGAHSAAASPLSSLTPAPIPPVGAHVTPTPLVRDAFSSMASKLASRKQ